MRNRIRTACALVGLCTLVIAAPALAKEKQKEKKPSTVAEKRAEIDKVAAEALDRLLAKNQKAKSAYEKAFGYAVFDNMRVTFLLTGGGGAGVAVEKASGKRTYMKMGTGGLALGIGAQKYQVIFLFENEGVFSKFIEAGWKPEAGANAAAGKKGANTEAEFTNGIAIYQITEKGLMASADISGTRYSKDKKLNAE